jgi:vancomycin resistance protein VanJ
VGERSAEQDSVRVRVKRAQTRDLVVPCGGGHNVRLKGGLRFFARARCPVCGAAVDPRYRLRTTRFVRNLGQPASSSTLDRAVWALALAALGLSIAAAIFFRLGADVWWPATVLLFGPRWVLLIPLVPLVVIAAWRDRALLVPLAAASAVLVGPVLGVTLGVRAFATRSSADDLVVVSFNAEGGEALSRSLAELVEAWDADVVMIQECGRGLRRAARDLDGWNSAAFSTMCTVSRLPILDVAVMEREALVSVGGSAAIGTYTLAYAGGVIRATNVHLETPRLGLELIRAGRVAEGAEALRQKSILREIELRRAERAAREAGGPALVLGDFNTPPESRHMATIWSRWRNAFSVAGVGIGGTRLNGWIRARIDHVMVDDAWTVVDAWVGDDVGSDHLPMLARLRLR